MQDLTDMFDSIGALERIAKTPMPFAHTGMLRIALLCWMLAFTLTSAAEQVVYKQS